MGSRERVITTIALLLSLAFIVYVAFNGYTKIF